MIVFAFLLTTPACATFTPTARAGDVTEEIEVGQDVRLHLRGGSVVQFVVDFTDAERIRGAGIEVLRADVVSVETKKISVLRSAGMAGLAFLGAIVAVALAASIALIAEAN